MMENGIIWSTDAIAPFTVAIVPMNMHKSEVVQQFSWQFIPHFINLKELMLFLMIVKKEQE